MVTCSLDGWLSLVNINFSEVVSRVSVPARCGGVTCASPASGEARAGDVIAGTESGRLVKVSFSECTVS
jgi:hypothetical protein